jgi:hypothetical protein
MKNALIAALFICLAVQGNSQTVAKSIFIEYGYVNLSKDVEGLQAMFGYTKYMVYDDDKFLKVESYQDLPAEEVQKMGPGIRSSYIKEKASNELYLCVSLDSLHIRMKADEEERSSFQAMTQTYQMGSEAVYATGDKKLDIQGFNCNEILIAGKYSDTLSAFVANQIVLDTSIADFPLYAVSHGLILGRDEILGNIVLEFRAKKLEINQPRDFSAELTAYTLVTKEAGEAMLKEAFNKMMGTPEEGDGKN